MQIFVPQVSHRLGYRKVTWSAYPGGAWTLPAHQQRVLVADQ